MYITIDLYLTSWWLYSLVPGPYWLGAYKEGTEWAWLSGVPIPLNSKYWHSGQPDGQGGNEKNLISGGDYFEGFGLDDGFDGMHCHALCEITMT